MSELFEHIKAAKRIGITGHVRPDGDCVGSCTALYNYIVDNYKDKDVFVYLESVQDTYDYLPNVDKIITTYPEEEQFDLFICLDSGDLKRTGFSEKYFNNAKDTYVVDHHVSNPAYGKHNVIEGDASSTCEVLFYLMEYDKISLNTAMCLYTGLIHDTGVFNFSLRGEKTMSMAGKLIEKGVPYSKIIDESFYKKTYMQTVLLGELLVKSELKENGKVIVSVADKELMDKHKAVPADIDGVVNQLRVTKGVEVAILMHEVKKGSFKISMRSNSDIDVSKICLKHGGGGHVKAAGCSMDGTSKEIIDTLIKDIKESK
ncbi:MAG: bifunctional oligoribonuclease/PAP phosphatase NrnA [Lachnospiraceae bacterium]|nr:bifunctional oligoribonuclease/PAP phosphatase NrnA [Lachnospiraceae bacterium]